MNIFYRELFLLDKLIWKLIFNFKRSFWKEKVTVEKGVNGKREGIYKTHFPKFSLGVRVEMVQFPCPLFREWKTKREERKVWVDFCTLGFTLLPSAGTLYLDFSSPSLYSISSIRFTLFFHYEYSFFFPQMQYEVTILCSDFSEAWLISWTLV